MNIILSSFNPLNNEEIQKLAPSVFSDRAKSELSNRYVFVSTSTVVDFMKNEGWFPVDAKEVKTRKQENEGFQKHMVRFRHPELSFNKINNDDNFVDILLTNSHDGKSSFVFQIGIFRLVCSNGLVVQTANYGTQRVRHLYDNEGEETFNNMLMEVLTNMVSNIPTTVEKIKTMQLVDLSEDEIKDFALKAAVIKFKDKIEEIDQEQLVDQLVQAKRHQDAPNNVWTVFNRVQEKIMKGDYVYSKENSTKAPRKARSIKNLFQQNQINSELFELAFEFAEVNM
jgi:hypothetical protein